MLLLPVVLALIAQFFCLSAYADSEFLLIAHREPAVTGRGPVGNFVVTARKILGGSTLGPEDVRIAQADAYRIPRNVYRKSSDAIGKIAKYELPEGAALSDVDILHNPNEALKSNRKVQISIDKDLFNRLETEARRQKITESLLAERLLEQKLEDISVGSKRLAKNVSQKH